MSVYPFIAKWTMKKLEILLGVLPIILAIIPEPAIYTLLDPLCFYILAYSMGRVYKADKVTKEKAIIAFGIMIICFLARFGVKIFADGTVLYERIAVPYTQYIAAFAIFCVFSFIFKNIKTSRGCEKFCKISFESYLCHYMFVVGPVSLMYLTSNFVINILITTIVSCGVAWALNQISRKFQKYSFDR